MNVQLSIQTVLNNLFGNYTNEQQHIAKRSNQRVPYALKF